MSSNNNLVEGKTLPCRYFVLHYLLFEGTLLISSRQGLPAVLLFVLLLLLFALSTGFCPNSHSCRQIGHRFLDDVVCNHRETHCKWKAWPHFPHTTGESSPGNLTPGAVPSNAAWQIPHTSSFAFQLHCATPWMRLILTVNRGPSCADRTALEGVVLWLLLAKTRVSLGLFRERGGEVLSIVILLLAAVDAYYSIILSNFSIGKSLRWLWLSQSFYLPKYGTIRSIHWALLFVLQKDYFLMFAAALGAEWWFKF